MKQRKSDIPPGVTERKFREYSEQENLIYFRVTECIWNGEVVGQRAYDNDGNLMRETPLRNGNKHGREYIWGLDGALESVEPYVDGQLHGLAKQYNRKGKVIGTYRFVHGSGYDIWRYERKDGSIGISEIFSVKDSMLHGYEWWPRAERR